MARQEITESDTPNGGRQKINENDAELYERVEVLEGAEGGGSPAALDDLTDVDTATTPPADGQTLVFDAASGLWLPGTVSGGSGGGSSGAIPVNIWSYNPDSLAPWFNMPAALTDFLGYGAWKHRVDLTNATQVRINTRVSVDPVAGAELRAQYSPDNGASWAYLDGVSGPAVDIGSSGDRTGAWANLAAGAKADVLVRVVGFGGDGATDPQFAYVNVQAK